MNFLVIGIIFIIWLGLLVVIAFRGNWQIVPDKRNAEIMVPIGAALAVWMWIFAVVVFTPS